MFSISLHQNGTTLGDVCRISYVNTQNKHEHDSEMLKGWEKQVTLGAFTVKKFLFLSIFVLFSSIYVSLEHKSSHK